MHKKKEKRVKNFKVWRRKRNKTKEGYKKFNLIGVTSN